MKTPNELVRDVKDHFKNETIITRYAPSPTGFLHLGHVVNAIYVWGIARAVSGKVLLRIENHDLQRCKPEYESAILDDLDWLGFAPDIGITDSFREGESPYRQGDCENIYSGILEKLQDEKLVYACECSRKFLQEKIGTESDAELRYPGFCKHKNLSFTEGLGIRICLPDEAITFSDLQWGTQLQHPRNQCGDFLIRDNQGQWTYQFCVTVDDYLQNVNLVIRGMDLLESTGRQIVLGQMLGRNSPAFFMHHSLLTDSSGRKLSKRDFDEDIHKKKQNGISAETVLGEACLAAGLISSFRPMKMAEVMELFVE